MIFLTDFCNDRPVPFLIYFNDADVAGHLGGLGRCSRQSNRASSRLRCHTRDVRDRKDQGSNYEAFLQGRTQSSPLRGRRRRQEKKKQRTYGSRVAPDGAGAVGRGGAGENGRGAQDDVVGQGRQRAQPFKKGKQLFRCVYELGKTTVDLIYSLDIGAGPT